MLTERYRPKYWDDFLGHREVIEVFKNIEKQGEYPPAILLFGPHGTGKTSFARVFAAYCLHLTEERSLESNANYREVDAASSGSVDFIRSLVEESQYAPIGSRLRRIVVVDECHMLSSQAQSALLKILESDTDTTFIFCTTDIKRVLPTLRARCLPMPTGDISRKEIVDHLAKICVKEGLEFERAALELIVSRNGGHVRDSLITLEVLKHGGSISLEVVRSHLGLDLRHEYYLLLLDILSIDDFSPRLEELLKRALPEDIRQGLLSVCLSVYKCCNGVKEFEEDPGLVEICAEVSKQLGKRALRMIQYWSSRKPSTKVSLECDLICFKSCVEFGFPGELHIDLPNRTKEYVSELDRLKHLGYKKYQTKEKKDDVAELSSVEDFQKILGGKVLK